MPLMQVACLKTACRTMCQKWACACMLKICMYQRKGIIGGNKTKEQ